jgi:hypothetical protein
LNAKIAKDAKEDMDEERQERKRLNLIWGRSSFQTKQKPFTMWT